MCFSMFTGRPTRFHRVFSSPWRRPLAPPLPTAAGGRSTALDLGASQGVDAEMMLRQGLQVVAVEGMDESLAWYDWP